MDTVNIYFLVALYRFNRRENTISSYIFGVKNILILLNLELLIGVNYQFFKYSQAIKTLIYTTNPIESLNSNIKRKTKSKGLFPTIDFAFKL